MSFLATQSRSTLGGSCFRRGSTPMTPWSSESSWSARWRLGLGPADAARGIRPRWLLSAGLGLRDPQEPPTYARHWEQKENQWVFSTLLLLVSRGKLSEPHPNTNSIPTPTPSQHQLHSTLNPSHRTPPHPPSPPEGAHAFTGCSAVLVLVLGERIVMAGVGASGSKHCETQPACRLTS